MAQGRRLESLLARGLLFLMPFEPRGALLDWPGFHLTALEAVAAAGLVVLLVLGWPRLGALLRRPPLPLLFLGFYAAAHLLSAARAPVHPALAVKFAARMVVMAAFAAVVAAALPPRARRDGLWGLVVAAIVVAFLAVGEFAGVRRLDPFLDLFRGSPFNVGGARRATAGSEYPNQAAGFLMCGLLAGVALLSGGRDGRAPRGDVPRERVSMFTVLGVAGLSAVLSFGLLATYSRGALIATAIGLVALSFALGRPRRRLSSPPFVALAVLVACTVAFAAAGEAFRLRLATEGIDTWYGATYEPSETRLALRPGETRLTLIRVTNTGQKVWSRDQAFHLSYHWFDVVRKSLADGGRTGLPRDLSPGDSVLLEAEVRAPDQEGQYLLVWDMVHEHTTWFSGQGVSAASVPVEVASATGETPPPPKRAPPPAEALVWRPGRGELWRLAFEMWRDHPLTGVGSDNFRWLYGPLAGHTFWDSRVFANNTLLEAAATTGTLGFLALAATLVSAPWTALRALGETGSLAVSAALFAMSVALAAHGLVDYLLAFTGHYLLFGFVVGGIAGLSFEGPKVREST